MGEAPASPVAHWRLGMVLALAVLALDQAHKLTMLFHYDMQEREVWPVLPFLDIVLVWNRGISYGLLQGLDPRLLLAFKMGAVGLLAVWLWRAQSRLIAVALGLIIGGAIGNGIDRAAYGAVADFFHLHWGEWSWYVFNLADCGIVAGAALLVYDAVMDWRRPAVEKP
jgi:signal peptidase II